MIDLRGVASADELAATRSVGTPLGTRTADPADSRGRLEGLLESLGITRVGCLSGLDRLGVPVHTAVRPQGRVLSSGSGKGATRTASWVSAVMEAAEHHAWEALAPSEVVATERTLRSLGATVVAGERLPRRRGTWWGPDRAIRWRRGVDVARGGECFVPDALVTADDDPGSPFVAGTNGLASGTDVGEAVLSGLLEVVERDGLSRLVRSGARREVEPSDVARTLERSAPEIADGLVRSSVRLEVLDATTDVGVPTYVCYLRDAPGERLGTFFGAGASLSADVALLRAVTEAAQSRTVVIAGARDDLFTSRRRASLLVSAPRPRRPFVALAARSGPGAGSIPEQLDEVAARLAAVGCDRIVVLRHQDVPSGLCVVRVIVPGLDGYPSARHASVRDHDEASA